MHVITKLRKLAEPHGLTIKDCGNGHIQITGGPMLVNYWPKPRKTPEDVCIEYAISAEAIRIQQRIISDPKNYCVVVNEAIIAYGKLVESESSHDIPSAMPSDETCLTKHWQIATGPPPLYREEPYMAYSAMCETCKIRLAAFNARREARRRLGAAKRSVEAIGKRLQKEASRG